MQAAINPQKLPDKWGKGAEELHRAGYTYRPGDKVMQIKNNYDKEVFNGDIGVIQSIDPVERTLVIRFDDRDVEYDVTELDEIVLAYATTVHKAQGAEYPIVVMPILMNHYVMLQRNLLYTGVTRAKKALMLVGTKKAIAYAVKNVTVDKRNTLLAWRLNGLADLCDHYGICLDHHKADSDSRAAAEILLRYIGEGVEVEKYTRTFWMG